jgi:hypothetical protein
MSNSAIYAGGDLESLPEKISWLDLGNLFFTIDFFSGFMHYQR